MSAPEEKREAAALRYDPRANDAPQVVARGEGALGECILELAAMHGVPVREDADLLQLLAQCDVGEEVPAELYAVVAELLVYLLHVNEESEGSTP